MKVSPLRYLNFESFHRLATDHGSMESLISLYQSIFGDPKVWGETYTRDDVVDKLRAELSGHANLRLCVRDGSGVIAFCWAQSLGLRDIARSIETIKYYQSIGMPDLTEPLREVIGDTRVIYIHELAIAAEFRGRIPLTELVYPVLCDVSASAGVDSVLFWSVAGTLVSRLAKRALFERRLAIHGMQFHLGTFSRVQGRMGDTLRWVAPTQHAETHVQYAVA